jgi:hypothetical protein
MLKNTEFVKDVLPVGRVGNNQSGFLVNALLEEGDSCEEFVSWEVRECGEGRT